MLNFSSKLNIDISKIASRAIHVTGTKGKGSTCAMVESIVRHHGYKTGMFTSPHMITVRERIQLNGKPISEENFAKYFWKCYDGLESGNVLHEPMLNYFRFLTVMAFLVFQEENVECAVVEVGIGGRTDATNVMDFTVACGIATIDYDHMNVLGNTLAEIAFEKTGIFKKGVPGISVTQVPEAHQMIIKRGIELGAPVYWTQPWKEYEQESKGLGNSLLALQGNFQHINASLAIALAQVWLQKKKF